MSYLDSLPLFEVVLDELGRHCNYFPLHSDFRSFYSSERYHQLELTAEHIRTYWPALGPQGVYL